MNYSKVLSSLPVDGGCEVVVSCEVAGEVVVRRHTVVSVDRNSIVGEKVSKFNIRTC